MLKCIVLDRFPFPELEAFTFFLEVSQFNDAFVQYWQSELEPGQVEDPSNRMKKKPLGRITCYNYVYMFSYKCVL